MELRANQLPENLPIFRRSFVEGQFFPAFTEDLTDSFLSRLVIEIQGMGSASLTFTGSDFSRGEPVLFVAVAPSRSVPTETSRWGEIKALYR